MTEQEEKCVQYFHKLILNELYDWEIDCAVCGGAIKDYFTYGYVKSDVDIFFKNEEEFKKVFNYLNEYHISYLETGNAINFKIRYTKIQFIKNFYFEDMNNAYMNFDFTVSCAQVYFDELSYHKTFFIDLVSKKLVINKLPSPLSTLKRIQKYVKRGYSICDGGLIKIARAIAQLDFKDPEQNILEFRNGEEVIPYID